MPLPWDAEWLVKTDRGTRRVPAFEFLRELPPGVREQLLAIVDAVRTTGPDGWRDTQCHEPMRGSCAHLHEARDRQGQTLYRLYLAWQRDEKRVVIINGASKANNVTLPDKFYEDLATFAATIDRDPPPFATADDFARIVLERDEQG
jgi:hypothetical protein